MGSSFWLRNRNLFLFSGIGVLVFAMAGCSGGSGSIKHYSLYAISDPLPEKKNEATAFVQLRKAGANVVTIITMEKVSQSFRVYKQAGGEGEFKAKTVVNSALPKGVGQSWETGPERTVTFKDPENSTLHDRYRIVPIVNGAEAAPLRIAYETDDRNYYKATEHKGPAQ
ncbi:MAG TPA: hypothetical protein VGJ94_01405 [Syntrophorhabdaceae bacterium]